MGKTKITINDVAKMAGVSKTAVSFAFNNPSKISRTTYDKIMDVCHKCGYVPNPVARTLTTKKIGSIGVLFPQNIELSFKNPYYSGLLQGIGKICSASGYLTTIITPLSGDINNSVRIAAVDGFITVGLEENMDTFVILKHRNLPFVCIDVRTSDCIAGIFSDDRKGIFELMKKVLEFGHRNIAVIELKSASQYTENMHPAIIDIRLEGIMNAVKDFGLRDDDVNIMTLESDCTIESGEKIALELFSSGKKISAAVCMSDIIAIGMLKYCNENGIDVPQRFSVCGFDNIAFSAVSSPPLTTVSQPVYAKGEKAAEMIIDMINDKAVESHIVFETELVLRKSLGKSAD